MKNNSYLVFALLVILFSYTLAEDISKQETSTDKKAKETADALKVEAKGDEGKYGVNYGGGGGGGGSGWGGGGGGHGGCSHGCCYRGHGGSCNRCCMSPEEAKAFSENQAETKEAVDTPKVEAKGDEEHYGVNYGGGGGGGGSGWGGGGGGHGGCSHGCCYRGYGGSCNRCCQSPEEAKAHFENQEEQYGLNYGGGGGGGGSGWGGGGGGHGGCSHGCCYRGYGGSCNRCCSSPEEAKAFTESQAEVKGDEEQYGVNYGGGGSGGGGSGWGGGGGGSGWGGGCRHGCCNYGYRGSCNRCCVSLKEAMAFTQAKGDEGKYGLNYGGGGGNHGGGGSGWGGCNHGCCQHGYGGSCNRCCASPAEAKAFAENQSRP